MKLSPRASPPRTPPPATPLPFTSHTPSSSSSLLLEKVDWGRSSLVQASTVAEPLTTGEGDVATEAAVGDGNDGDDGDDGDTSLLPLLFPWTETQTRPEGTTSERSSLMRSSRTSGGDGGGGGGGQREGGLRRGLGRGTGRGGGRAACGGVPVVDVVGAGGEHSSSPPVESSRLASAAAFAAEAVLRSAFPSSRVPRGSWLDIEPSRGLPGTRERAIARELDEMARNTVSLSFFFFFFFVHSFFLFIVSSLHRRAFLLYFSTPCFASSASFSCSLRASAPCSAKSRGSRAA